jgi:hypothetical protein
MIRSVTRTRRFLLLAVSLASIAAVAACSSAAKKKSTPVDNSGGPDTNTGDEMDATVLMPSPTGSQTDIGDHPSNNSGDPVEGGRAGGDTTEGGASDDAGAPVITYCTGGLVAGDIRVVELMIKSSTSVADDGEWIELQSARDCILKLGGVTIESPWSTDGGTSGVDKVTLPTDFELQPNAIFVVADTSDTTSNHGIMPVFSFDTVNSLDDTGDTVTVKQGNLILDAFTYPAFTNLPTARSVSFPADCAWSQRTDFSNWSYSFATYSTGFQGTPNTDNTDVACP